MTNIRVKDTTTFVQKAKQIHGDVYDYSKVNYINSATKVTIVCTKHGDFDQFPGNHFSKNGCPECVGKKRLNTESFIKKCINAYGDKFTYLKTNYVRAHEPVIITCKEHGDFSVDPSAFINNPRGCPTCSKPSKEYFIKRSQAEHGDKYDYSLIPEHPMVSNKLPIICPEHGVFVQIGTSHISGAGCLKCSKYHKVDTEEFIQKSRELFGDIYVYDKTRYKKAHDKVLIKCKKHGYFEVRPSNHINSKQGCYQCSEERVKNKC